MRSSSTISSPLARKATRGRRGTSSRAAPIDASTPISAGPIAVPAASSSSPSRKSSPRRRTFFIPSRALLIATRAVPPSVSSTRITVSVPAGTGAPVMTRTAVPGASGPLGDPPAATLPLTGSTTGAAADALAMSAARTA